MYETKNPIKKNTTENFDFFNKIPADIQGYTAIGKTTARYYVLYCYTEYGFLANTAEAMLHLILHSKSPYLLTYNKPTPPPAWNPQVFPRVMCQ